MNADLPLVWNRTALSWQLPEGVALPEWWERAEALGWSPESCASAAALCAPVRRRVYPDPESDRYEVVRASGAVTEVTATHLGGYVPAWESQGETWVDRPWRWTHPSARTSLEGEGESLAALLWRRSRELSAAARAA